MKLPQQSPIDINTYHSSSASELDMDYRISDIEVDGHGANYTYIPKEANHIILNGAPHELQQFHFHHPSEHKLKGKYFDSELHLVHSNPSGNLFIIGVFLDTDVADSMISEDLTFEKEDVVKELKDFDLKSLLPKDLTHYQYMGSLTTPPYTEGAYWMVMKEPIGISKAQLDALKKLIPTNSREPQELNDRKITLMNE